MKNLYTIFAFMTCAFLALSCKKDKPEPKTVSIDILELQNGDYLRFGEDIKVDVKATGNPLLSKVLIQVKSDIPEEGVLLESSFDVSGSTYHDTLVFDANLFQSEGTEISVTASVTGSVGNAIKTASIPYVGDSLVLRGLYVTTDKYIYDYSFSNGLYSKIQIPDSAIVDYWADPNLLIIADTHDIKAYSPKSKSIVWETTLNYKPDEFVQNVFIEGEKLLVVSSQKLFTFMNEQGGVTKSEIPKDVKQVLYMDLGEDYIFIQDTNETYFLQNSSLIKTISFGGVFYRDIHYAGDRRFVYNDGGRLYYIESNSSFTSYLAFTNDTFPNGQVMDNNTVLLQNEDVYYQLVMLSGKLQPVGQGKVTHAYFDRRRQRILALANNKWLIHEFNTPYPVQVERSLSDILYTTKKDIS